jgi:hypothetical protein
MAETRVATLFQTKTNRLIAAACVVVAVIAGYAILNANAANANVSLEPELASVNPTAKVVTDGAASGGKAVQFGAAVITPDPDTPPGGNSSIKKVTPGTSWQLQLTGTINETILDNVSNTKKLYDIDLFDTPAATISRLKAKNITVACYFSAGSSENWRSDFSSFPASVQGKALDDWPGEKWLDVRQVETLRGIMSKRMDLAVQKGCDAVDPDNVDGYTNDTGFTIKAADQLAYNRMLATEAHKRNLSIGLKNDVDQISQLASDFDWALNEQCYQYDECGAYSAFISQNKAVFGVEYQGNTSTFCTKANNANYDWLKKDLELGATPRTACRNG